MQMTQENELVINLKELVIDYLKKNPSLTLHALALRSNVSSSSLRRLVLGTQKFEVAPHSVLNLVSYIFREKNISKLIKKIDQSIAEFLKKHFGSFIFINEQNLKNLEPETYFKDQTKFLIYRLGKNHNGIEVKKIEQYLGQIGLRKMDEMLTDGVLEMRGAVVFSRPIEYQLNNEIIRDHLPALFQIYQGKTADENISVADFFNESLSLEAITKINEIRKRYLEEISSITTNSENFGEIPYIFFSLKGTII